MILDIDAVCSRILIVHLMEEMVSAGFFVTSGVKFSRSSNNKTLLLLKKGQPLKTHFMCLSLNCTDRI